MFKPTPDGKNLVELSIKQREHFVMYHRERVQRLICEQLAKFGYDVKPKPKLAPNGP